MKKIVIVLDKEISKLEKHLLYLLSELTLNKEIDILGYVMPAYDLILKNRNKVSIGKKTLSLFGETKYKIQNDFKKLDCLNDLNYECDFYINCSVVPTESLKLKNKSILDFKYMGRNFLTNSKVTPGLYEFLNKSEAIKIEFLEYINGKYILVEKLLFNTHWVMSRNFTRIISYLPSVIIKKCLNSSLMCERRNEECLINLDSSILYFRYAFTFSCKLFKKTLSLLSKGFLFSQNQDWALYLGNSSFLNNGLKDLKSLKPKENEFWADPFLFKYKNETFVFFERFPFQNQKGVIACGKIKNNEIIEIKDVLALPYHLSYPYIFEEDGEIYMMPESSEKKRLELYICLEFPTKWSLYSVAFENKSLADTVYFKDKMGLRWLLTSRSSKIDNDHCTQLYIYQIDSLKMNKIIPHRLNPIYTDATLARNGGLIYEENNKTYRVSQINAHGVYGSGININEIRKLTIDDFKEKTILKLDTHSSLIPYLGIHQMCQLEESFVIDARYK